ncbi:MAG: glycoside hydrolase family 16 protein [Polyangiales bacterium]
MSKLAPISFVLAFTLGCSSGDGDAPSTETDSGTASTGDDTGTTPDTLIADTMVEETATDSATTADVATEETLPGWKVVWSDEFDGADGSAVDPKKWKHDTGGNGFGNQEREFYTDGTENAQIEGGNLIIKATKDGADKYTCWYGKCEYTSARLLSAGLFQHSYGRFAARIQIPRGQGIWPAFWMLGADIGSKPWPSCGEIDIMENIGKEPKTVHGTIHGPGYSGAGGIGAPYSTPSMTTFADDFHVYAVEWSKDEIKWFVDDALYETRTPKDLPAGKTWVYDHDFFLLLNLAVGGQWPGNPDGTSTFPQEMKVDWVRVYEKS